MSTEDVMPDRKLRLAFNRGLLDKNEAGDHRLFVDGFQNADVTLEELAACVAKGIAFTAQLTGKRKAKNFLASDVVSVDIDGGLTIDQVLLHPLVVAHAGLVYTTVSHTAEASRLRVVFPLPKTITDPREMRAIQRSLALQLGGDVSATDPERIFFGNSNAQIFVFPDRCLTIEMQEQLIAQSERAIARRGAIMSRPVMRSALRLDPNQLVTLATGQQIAFSKINGKSQLHCPFHHDNRPSAYVVVNAKGVRGIHCSACDDSFWPDDADGFDPFSFDAEVLRAHAEYGENICHTGLGPLLGLDGRANVTIVPAGSGLGTLMPGLTFVKAPKGAGKTEALKFVLPYVGSALFIVHRRTLTRQSCRRLGLSCYLDFGRLDHDRIGICFDSLLRLPADRRYDLVVIDEVEQVLAHILGDTISSADRVVLFRKLVTLLRGARFVVAMDADIGWASFTTLTRLMTGVIPDPAQGDLFGETHRRVRILMNTSKPGAGKTVELYKSKAHLLAELVSALAEGKRVFVASNSKAFAAKISALVTKKLPNRRQLLLTADTASAEPQKKFLEAPADEALKYDAIITSPAAGTGLDVTFPDRATMIDLVVGFCEADIVTHWDFDQHISRVRQPGAVKVWISPEQLYYETHADVVRREVLDRILAAHVILNDNGNGSTPCLDEDPLVEMATMLLSQQRWSKNQIRKHFIAHKQAQGFEIIEVDPNNDLKAEGRVLLKHASEIGDEEYARRVAEARPLSRVGYQRVREAIKAGVTVSQDQLFSIARTAIERFYRAPLSAGLIERDQRGKARDRIVLFEGLTKMLPHAPGAALAKQSAVIREREQMLLLLCQLIEATPLIKNGAWDRDAIFCGENLEAFCQLIEKERRVFETQLQAQVRRDLRTKPVLQLKHVLRKIGLDLELVHTKKVGASKRYFYRLDRAVLQRQAEITHDRATVSVIDFMQQLHGEILDEDDDAEEFFGGSA
jgi:hypothetical protein